MRSLLLALTLLSSYPPVEITDAWARATPPGAKNGAGYLTLKSAEADKLLKAESDVARVVEIHEMSMKGGVMSMKALEGGLALPKGEAVKLAPGGLHLMFLDLKAPLAEGQKIAVTLHFEKAGARKVELDVRPIGAKHPTGHAH